MSKRIKTILYTLVAVAALLSFLYRCFFDCGPVDAPDFTIAIPSIPDEKNAYLVYTQIDIEAFPHPKEELYDYLSGNATNRAPLDSFLAATSNALTLARSANERPYFIVTDAEGVNESLTCRPLNLIARATRIAFLAELDMGNTREAADHVHELCRMANLSVQYPRSITHQFLFDEIGTYAFGSAYLLALDPGVNADDLARISQTLAESPSPSNCWAHAIKGTVHLASSTLRDGGQVFADGAPPSPEFCGRRVSYRLHPNRTLKLFVPKLRQALDCLPRPYSRITYTAEEDPTTHTLIKIVANVLPNAVGRKCVPDAQTMRTFLRRPYLRAVELTAARTVIAIRRFEIDHGDLPESLRQLVPKYLLDIPIDPFDGDPFRYDPDSGVIYSVGHDCVDQNGVAAQPHFPPRQIYPRCLPFSRLGEDIVFPVNLACLFELAEQSNE